MVRARSIALLALVLLVGAGVTAVPAQAAPTADAPGWTWERVSGGVRYASPLGTYLVPDSGGVVAEHGRLGGGRGELGYPTGPLRSDSGGSYQTFERGVVYASWRGTFAVKGGASPFARVHGAHGGGSGSELGYPAGREVRQASGYWYQPFSSGVVYVGPGGAYAVTARSSAGFDAEQSAGATHQFHGGGGGALGYPVSGRVSEGGRYSYQRFERGVIYCGGYSEPWLRELSPACAAVRGGFVGLHAAQGGGRGALGYPMLDEIRWETDCEGQPQPLVWEMIFERGSITVTASGSTSIWWGSPPLHFC